ncbi:hypothetical protein HMPREF1991_01822 [Hoylesella loescheii DSM 19665 = JCM 12249 = ATCC 15930]|uniref:Uncharacterized protein n=1 Tax=Hoylesella loescheii DSM 19665 = JCM 12249 = ATCC 15930 TaxID=1122985 RepID=A0A069QH00_HOYLO|nr:hypothetical protein HMPREF1991_01822 [Hoylesella loescheii DSM 19665 = JCM 12249 = ATCC 15930]
MLLFAPLEMFYPCFCNLSNIVLANNKIVLACNDINNYLCIRK